MPNPAETIPSPPPLPAATYDGLLERVARMGEHANDLARERDAFRERCLSLEGSLRLLLGSLMDLRKSHADVEARVAELSQLLGLDT